nr:ATP-binding protein [uncultured Sphingomonas sp.]
MLLLIGLALLLAQAVNFAFVLNEQQKLSLAQNEGPAISRFVQAAVHASGTGLVPPRAGRGANFTFADEALTDRVGLERSPEVEGRVATALADAGISASQVRAAKTIDVGRFAPGGRDRRLHQRRGERQVLLLAAKLPSGVWLNGRLDAPRSDPWLIARLLAATLVLYALVLAATWWIARRIVRPVRDLTVAAESFHGRSEPVNVEPRGPADIRRAVEAFNAMNTRLSSLLNEKDRMLGAIGHDLRTPLASIRIRAENMEPASERDRLISTVEETAAMLEDILVLARTGRNREESRAMNVTALIDAIVEDYRERGCDVSFEAGAAHVADIQPNLLRRAVRNLIDNALRYGRRARVRVVNGPAIEIDDDGPGIAEAELADVMEPFKRLERSRSRETGGAGLGLAIAKAVAEAHGGTLRLSNRASEGLTASLSLRGD